ncbi:phenylacetate-CoA ligase [Devosia sp. YR412]|uniref:phenylacetate--CoA ligase family protein n=1 Tax=Devosia sp. YR412 TaxID=1881030 RepID=UPI0008BDD2A6|nr:AMP-binding protein [Devosia sp. YR412]SEQ49120.1 phenylacetate-CoA ligase [Devosia sp. YR412]
MSTDAPIYTLPDVQRQPLEAVRSLQNQLLRRMVEICYDHHPFYSELMRTRGLTPADIQNVDDLQKIPPSSKTDFLADPEAFRLRPEGLPLAEGTLWKIIYTTGTTTGKPAPIFVTSHDHFAYQDLFRTRQDLIGLRNTDLIANLFPLTSFPMGAYSRGPDEAAAVGAAMLIANTGRVDSYYPVNRSVDDAVASIARHKATVLWGVAGFVRRVLLRAAELGADFTSVRMVMTTGEAASPAMRDDLRLRMRNLNCADTTIVNRYGSTEQGGTMIECCDGSGFHSSMPDQVFHEVVDAESGARLNDGETGMLAITHLNRRGTVFLRYKVGDMGALDHTACPHCGRTSVRLSSKPVRTGDIIKIKGALVNLGNLKAELDKIPELEEYQIVVTSESATDPFSPDVLKVRLAPVEGKGEGIGTDIAGLVTKLTNLRPEIEIAKRDEIFDPVAMAKPKRIVDLRQR